MTRRKFIHMGGGSLAAVVASSQGCASFTRPGSLQASTFDCDVTPPLGHAMMGGGIPPAQSVADTLHARGFVLLGLHRPIVFMSIEWCEIRNDALATWRRALAEAVGTDPQHVLISCVHVHDAPIADLTAERLLRARASAGSVCDLTFHESAVRRVATAARDSLKERRRITHFGMGQAEVQQIASNRRYLLPDGKPSYDRMSATRNVIAREGETGTIDPFLKSFTLWDGDSPVAAVHAYATHPMSHYGRGAISADFPGMALARIQAEFPKALHLYASGCSGNVTAGKWNDGAPENRARLADRLYQGMRAAFSRTERHRLDTLSFRNAPLRLAPRSQPGFSQAELEKRLAEDPKPFGQCLAALGLSWRHHASLDAEIDVPAVNFGAAQLLLLPAESYVEFQLFAQSVAPDRFVLTCGYGECGPGYIPIERAWQENDSNLHDWCWINPGSETAMKNAIRDALATT
jgi:hypothetical protein